LADQEEQEEQEEEGQAVVPEDAPPDDPDASFGAVSDGDDASAFAGAPLPPASGGWRARRANRRREREERKARARAERERARAERREAIERRRAERSGARTEEPDDFEADDESVGSDGPFGDPSVDPVRADSEAEAQARLSMAERREDDARVRAHSEQVSADADRRVREIEQISHTAEGGVAEAQLEEGDRERRESAGAAEDALPLANELRLADQQIERRRRRDQELLSEIERTESRIEANRERTERALEEARARLEQLESQAGEAEERAARAERLAQLRGQEAERESRLHEMLERINEADRRAREAEARAREAVAGAARPGEPASPPPADPVEPGPEAPSPVPPDDEDAPSVDINEATFEELRGVGLSVTQTGRILAHRERSGGFGSVDELYELPGFPREFLDGVRARLTA